MDKVKVLFRMGKNPYTECWECVAFFPEFVANRGMIQCYTEEGWCEASLDYYHHTRKAAPEEYAKMYAYLKNESEEIVGSNNVEIIRSNRKELDNEIASGKYDRLKKDKHILLSEIEVHDNDTNELLYIIL